MTAHQIVSPWLDRLREGEAARLLPAIESAARTAVRSLELTGNAFVDLSPGDSTRYRIVLVDLHSVEGHSSAVDELGGTLLVTLPDPQRRAAIFGQWLQTPEYVTEHLELSSPWTGTVVACLLTLIAEMR